MTCDYGLLYGQSSGRGNPLLVFLWAATVLCQVCSPVYNTNTHTHSSVGIKVTTVRRETAKLKLQGKNRPLVVSIVKSTSGL